MGLLLREGEVKGFAGPMSNGFLLYAPGMAELSSTSVRSVCDECAHTGLAVLCCRVAEG